MKLIFTCLFSCLFLLSFSQQSFRKSYGAPGYGEFANNVIKLKDGTFVVTGSTDNFGAGSFDAFCIRMDANGKTLWSKTFGDSSFNAVTKSVATADGGFVMCFTSYRPNNPPGIDFNGLFVVKCNKEGQRLWSKSIKSPSLIKGEVSITPYQVYESKAGDIYILSSWFSFDYDADYSLTKLDASGNLKWNNSVSLIFTFFAQFDPVQITEADNGDIIVGENLVADYFYSFDDEIHISVFSAQTGARVFSRTILQDYNNGFGYLRAYSLTVKHNTLIVSGSYYHDYTGGGESWFALRKEDTAVTVFYDVKNAKNSRPPHSADELARQKYTLTSRSTATPDGGYISAYSSNDPDYDIIVEKHDSLGRICTDTSISYPSATHRRRTICQVYGGTDRLLPYIFVSTDTTITVNNINAEKTLCETFATPQFAVADKDANAFSSSISHSGMQLYPNPATDHVIVTFETTQPSAIRFTVITADGRTVLTQQASVTTGKQQVTVNVKNLSPGIYYIKMNGLASTGVMKFVKQ